GPAVANVLLGDEDGRALDLVGGEDSRRPCGSRGIDEGEVFLPTRLDAGGDARSKDAGDRRDAAVDPLHLGPGSQGYTAGASSPLRSSHPIIMLRFWMPLAEPPLPT